MHCSRCDFDNPEGMKFCGQCATPLSQCCPSCGFENPPGFAFCGQCATSLTGLPQVPTSQATALAEIELPPPQLPTPDAERRQLTVMFCDLADSTRLSGQLDPEDLRDVIRAYQSASAEVIERYDGYIAQHLGDGLMVYFGWPQAHEDDARRAVHAGLGILEAMQGLNVRLKQEKGIRLAVRIGIHTGLVVVGEIGQGASQEHLALGETPNVASRIEGIAEPGTVTISGATFELVQGYFVCETLRQYALRGVHEPQPIYRVEGVSGAQNRFEVGLTRELTPLVGRELEIGLLFERWQQVKDGMGQVVLLSGDAGIGKSRLLQVMRDHVANEPHTRLECRSSPYYQNTALYPITDLLQRALRWQQDDTPDQRLAKLEQALSHYRLSLEESVPLFAALLSLPIPEDRYPPINLSPQRQRQKTLESIVAILLEQAERQPVLFVLEDLHWLDPTSLELLDRLLEQTPTTSVLTLLTCRPTFQPPWGSRSYLTQMTLSRLSRRQIESMAERVAGGKRLPSDVMQQIIEKTDGVPLFVEEMTKVVLESDVLKQANGQYELAGSISTLTIPATLQDSLMARLDRLVTAKAVAQYASVIGRHFSYELLQAVSQLNEVMLQHELGRLVEAELLYQRGPLPQATYTFKHALVRDVAYESLLKRTRQHYHQRIARALENRFPEMVEVQPELLAYHFTEAGLAKEAILYWQRAGERSAGNSAYLEAIAHFTKSLEVLATLPETPHRAQRELTLQLALGAPLQATKGYAASERRQAYSRAWELCQQYGETSQRFPVLFGLWQGYGIGGELRRARELGEQLLSIGQAQDDSALLLEAHRALAWTLHTQGDLTQARQHAEQGMVLYDPQRHHDHAILYGQDPGMTCCVYLGWTLWLLGFPDQALDRANEAIGIAQQRSHLYSVAMAQVYKTAIHQCRREIRTTQAQAEVACNLCTEQDFAFFLAYGSILRGWALTEQGQGDAGVQQIQQGLEAFRATGAICTQTYFFALLAQSLGVVEQPVQGLRVLTEALQIVEETSERWWEAELYRLRGTLMLSPSVQNHTEAETCLSQALDVARRQQAKSWELRAATSLARLWQNQGKRQDAYDLLAPVYGWFTEGFDTADLKDSKALLDELAG